MQTFLFVSQYLMIHCIRKLHNHAGSSSTKPKGGSVIVAMGLGCQSWIFLGVPVLGRGKLEDSIKNWINRCFGRLSSLWRVYVEI